MSLRPHQEHQYHGSGPRWLQPFQHYLAEFVYGGIDGSVTTFAVVAGASGAELDARIVLILGFANLIADGFSMSVGSYLSRKSEQENFRKHESIEYWEVDNLPERERQEVREIMQEKGFDGPLLERVVEVLTADRDRWVDVMMKEELGMMRETRSPLAMAAVTFFSFLLVGFIPLFSYILEFAGAPLPTDKFWTASALTGLAFVFIGYLKSYVSGTHRLRSILETLLLGSSAAVLAYFAGDLLERWLT
jgi:VIT1/CCC1 family predicted Fe2+/Mn2+ transporter